MQKNAIVYIFLCFSMLNTILYGQENQQKKLLQNKEIPWQDQLLQLVDIEDLGESEYNILIEELSELVLWSDTLQGLNHKLKQQLILSSNRCLNTRAGFIDQTEERQGANKAYLGDPWHQAVRYRLKRGDNWQAGISMEKDAGEAWRSHFPCFDSWHAYVRYQQTENRGDIRKQRYFNLDDAVIGHYRLQIGYGLTINQSFSLGKQYFLQQIYQRTNRISPYASSAESDFMQGAAFDLRIGKHVHVLPYFSMAQIDGNLSDKQILSTLYDDGMHRTKTEDSHRNASWMMVMGVRAGWRGSWYDLGLHVLNTQYQYPYERKQMSHNMNYFRGQSLTQFAADYQFNAFRNILKGEFAADDKFGFASLTSLQTRWTDNWQTNLMYYYYSVDYRQIHGSSIGENSELQGEQGVTLNVNGSLSKHWQIQAMADWFNFGQPQYQTDGIPKDGYEGLLKGIYTSARFSTSLSYKVKSKNETLRHSIDGIFAIYPSRFITLKTQLRKKIYTEDTSSQGFSVAQSLVYKSKLGKTSSINIDTQAAYFDTDDYDSRIYINEKNILYGFGYPMLYGQGVRYNVTANLKLGRHWNIEAKYALTNYNNRASISSGLQEIKGNTQQDLWLQVRISY